MTPKSGKEEGIPYSLSRWTDLPIAKWAWFREALRDQKMIAIDPRTGAPAWWSLKPEDTLGMVFWTKDPTNLIKNVDLLRGYNYQVHVTATGWEEVEKGAPSLLEARELLHRAAKAFGPERVFWRFSPVPLVPDVLDRFGQLLEGAAQAGLKEVYLTFLQTNDMIPETRSTVDRLELLVEMAADAARVGVSIRLCNEDRLLHRISELPDNLGSGVCAKPELFALPGSNIPPSEGCGCVLMADPFTVNESCSLGCAYCYAADKDYAPKKRNTTRGLPVIR